MLTQCLWCLLAVVLQGWVRSIGISNMGVPEMTQLAATAKVTPAVNQIELHPWLQWKHVTDYCREHGIVLEVGLLLHASADMHRPAWSSRKHPGTTLVLSQCRRHNMLCVFADSCCACYTCGLCLQQIRVLGLNPKT